MLPIHFFGIISKYVLLNTNKKESTPISKKKPIPKILKQLITDKFKSASCHIKNTILKNNENNKNHFEKPTKTDCLVEKI